MLISVLVFTLSADLPVAVGQGIAHPGFPGERID